MGHADATGREPTPSGGRTWADWQAGEEAVLERVKTISRRITERVERVIGDTQSHAALPDPTGEAPPLA